MKDHYRRSSFQSGKVIIVKMAWRKTVREIAKNSGPSGQVKGFINRRTPRRDQRWLMVGPKIAGNGRGLATGGGGGPAPSASRGSSPPRSTPGSSATTSARP